MKDTKDHFWDPGARCMLGKIQPMRGDFGEQPKGLITP